MMIVVTENVRGYSMWVRRIILYLCEGDRIARGRGRKWNSLFELTIFSGQLEMFKVEFEFDCFPPSVLSRRRPGSPENHPFWMSQLMFPQVDVPGQLIFLLFFPCIFSIWVARAFLVGRIGTVRFLFFYFHNYWDVPKRFFELGIKST